MIELFNINNYKVSSHGSKSFTYKVINAFAIISVVRLFKTANI